MEFILERPFSWDKGKWNLIVWKKVENILISKYIKVLNYYISVVLQGDLHILEKRKLQEILY